MKDMPRITFLCAVVTKIFTFMSDYILTIELYFYNK